jgi:hypothetical protein
VQLTDVGQDWTSHASATLDANGWVHLSGYLGCLGASGCADQMITLPAAFGSASSREVFPFIAEQVMGSTSQYSPGPSVIELSPTALTVPDAASGILNGWNVWLSGITYKAVSSG